MHLDASTIWRQPYLVFGWGLSSSALVAALPVITLFYLVGLRRRPAWIASLAGLAITLLVATVAYGMPIATASSAAANGAAFGLFPIAWIVFWAIALFEVTVATGKFEQIKRSIGSLTTDSMLQALLIGFVFGAFIEGAAGFGTPVAVAGAMLTGLGFTPFDAAAICLLANTAPVAFGSIGIPILTLAGITGLDVAKLSGAVGWICAPLSFIIPAYLTVATAGMRALRTVWPAAVVGGCAFATVQLLAANYIGPQLTDILASLSAIGALLFLLRMWRPLESASAVAVSAGYAGPQASAAGSVYAARRVEPGRELPRARGHNRRELASAWMPYALLIAFLLVWGAKPAQALLDSASISFPWPWLHNVVWKMPPVVAGPVPYAAIFHFKWLSASGTSCMFATLVSAALLGMHPGELRRLLVRVARQLLLPAVTIASVLGMAFLMNYCGATGTLGLAAASTGRLFPFFSPLLGWLGVFLTGSDTSANALFGSLQVVTAERLSLDSVLMAAANSSGGVAGKMISLQTIAVVAAATGMPAAQQARLFRFALKHSILLACAIGLLVLAYSVASPF